MKIGEDENIFLEKISKEDISEMKKFIFCFNKEIAKEQIENIYLMPENCWVIRLKKDNNIVIGFTKIYEELQRFQSKPALIIAIRPGYQKKGYGFSAGKITTEYALNHLKLKELIAVIDRFNQPSLNLIRKLKYRFIEADDLRVPTDSRGTDFF